MLLNLESGAYAFTADPDEGEVTIGRENDCNFIVKEEGVSRHHCKLWFENENWLVQDSESRWGTLVNNKQIHKPTALKTGDVLRLSNVNFMVSLHRTNDNRAIGKQLAGGARDKLKILDDNNKAAAAKPTRMFKAPNKDSNKRLKAALKEMDDEPKVTEEEGVTIIDDQNSDIDPATGVDPRAETAITSPTSSEPAPEEAPAESEEAPPAKPDKKGSKLRLPAKGATSAKTAARPAKGARAPKEKDEPKKGSPLVKIIVAVVVLAGVGAAAYFATDGFGANAKESNTSTEKKDADNDKEAPSDPVIPPKKSDDAAKDEKTATENPSNSGTDSKQ